MIDHDDSSEFEQEMKRYSKTLADDVRQIVLQVLTSEHKFRFSDRSDLPKEFATRALDLAKVDESGDEV